jgi:predicted small lipoprotein YifL
MVRSRIGVSRRLAAALLVFGALGGCGKKGPPMPPLRHNPAAAQDLTVYQQGSEWVLQAAYPKTTVAGMALPGLEAIEVWSMERPAPPATPPPAVAPATAPALPAPSSPAAAAPAAPPAAPAPPGPDPREFMAQARLARTLRGAELAGAVVGDRLLVRLPAPAPATPAMATVFAIKTVATGGDASAFSNLVSVTPAQAPEPPGGLTTTPRPNGVEVSWAPASPAPLAYRVYRRSAQARGYGDAIHQSPASESSHIDTTARLGERYVYTVAALASETPLVLSPLSAESEVDYQDRFPPPPPPGLVALPQGAQVRLRWNASEAEDTAGYIVFRQDPGGEFHRVTAAPISDLEYVDSGLVAGNTYRYRVAAVDRAGNEGQPGDTVEGIVR